MREPASRSGRRLGRPIGMLPALLVCACGPAHHRVYVGEPGPDAATMGEFDAAPELDTRSAADLRAPADAAIDLPLGVDAADPSVPDRAPDRAADLAPDQRAADAGREAPPPDLAPDGPPPADLTRGLIGYWRFDETTGTAARDSSPRANNGMLIGLTAASWTPGQIKGGLRFDPLVGGLVVVPNAATLNPTTGLSAGAWVMADDWATNRRILQKGQDNQYRLLAEDAVLKFNVGAGVGNTVEAALPSVGVWHHVVGTYDGVTVRLYVDGQELAAKATTSAAVPVTASNLHIGHKDTESIAADSFSGVLDEVVLYGRALSGAEVRLLFSGKTPL